MEQGTTVVVSGGGIRSLVATAAVAAQTQPQHIVLLHLRDGRVNVGQRTDHVHRQATHYLIDRIVELEMPHLQQEPFVLVNQDGGASPLIRPQTLMAAIGQAIRLKAVRLVWPVQVNGDYPTIARATEEVVLVEHMVRLELQQSPTIELPLVDLTDQQLVELGGQLEVPWELAWTCMFGGEKPCRNCAACQHRHAAFEAAGVVDPIEKQATGARG